MSSACLDLSLPHPAFLLATIADPSFGFIALHIAAGVDRRFSLMVRAISFSGDSGGSVSCF
ncbi:MAG TPA: hypothetical protein VIF82_17105 [Burkholderiaceae bacterium]